MKRNILSILLAALLIASMLPVTPALAANDQFGVLYSDDWTTLIQFPPAAVDPNTGQYVTDYTIDSRCNTIQNNAFQNAVRLISVTMPAAMRTIGNSAFQGCTALQSVTLGGTTAINQSAFQGCTALESITWGSTATIGSSAFSGCTALENVTIGQSVATIGASAFSGCTKLKSVTFPASLVSIADGGSYYGAFLGCTNLETVTFADSAASIGSYTFSSLTNLKEVDFGGRLVSIGDNAFYNCNSLTAITIPSTVMSIGGYAFSNCYTTSPYVRGLTTVVFDNSAATVGASAFQGCQRLSNVSFGNNIRTIGNSAFSNTGLVEVTIPASVESIGTTAFQSNAQLKTAHIGRGVLSIGTNAFSSCPMLENILVDAQNPYFADVDGVFGNKGMTTLINYPPNKLLTNYTIPSTVNRVEDNAFQNAIRLVSVTMPAAMRTVGNNAFQGCTALQSVTLGGTTAINQSAFQGCTALENITWGSTATIGTSAFYGCTALENVSIGQSVATIGASAFSGCTKLKSVTFPASLVSIADGGSYYGAFLGCTNLETVTFADSAASIGSYTFSGLTNLKEVDFGGRLVSIGDNAFYNCNSLTAITIPSTVMIIGGYAFSNCYTTSPYSRGLTTVVFDNCEAAIGTSAFQGCQILSDVSFGNNIRTIGTSAFSNTGLVEARIPCSVISIGTSAFANSALLEAAYLCDALSSSAIGANVFSNCPKFTGTTVLPHNDHVTISVSHQPKMGGTFTGGGIYARNAQVRLTAIPSSTDHSFTGWFENNAIVSGAATYTFTATTNRTLEARFTGGTVTSPVWSLWPDSLTLFPTATVGYGVQSSQDININNYGPGSLTSVSASLDSSAFEIVTHPASTVPANGERSSWISVRPKTGLSAGTYTGAVSVTTANGGIEDTKLSFTVIDESSLTYGDVDGNGVVTNYDAILILRYANEWDMTPYSFNLLTADVDGNGMITNYDAILILRYVNGWFDKFPVETTPAASYSATVPTAPSVQMLAAASAAENDPVVSVISPSGAVMPGDTINLQVSMEGNPGVMSLRMGIEYDSSALQLDSTTSAWDGMTYTPPQNPSSNPYNASWISNTYMNNNRNGVILNLQFTVLSGAADGTYPITLTFDPLNTFDEYNNPIALNLNSGSVTVGSGSTPNLTLSTSSWNPPASGGSITVSVTSNVPWTASSNATSWLTVTPASGSNNGSLTLTALANTGTSSRTGTITVTGGGITRTITVNQGGGNVPAIGVSSAQVNAGDEFTLTVSLENNPGVMSLRMGIEYDASALRLDSTTSAWDGMTYTPPQNPSSNPYSASWISNTYMNNNRNGAILTLQFTALSSATGGTYPITLTYDPLNTFDENNHPIALSLDSGSVTVGSGSTPNLTLSSSSWNPVAAGGSTTVSVTSNVSWTASSNATSWLTVTPASGSNNGSLTLTAQANTGTSSRTGTITVTGGGVTRTVTVNQVGEAVPTDLTFTVESTRARAGEKVEVPILVTNNPGVAQIRLEITLHEDLEWDYDPAAYGTNPATWPFISNYDVLPISGRPTGSNLTESFVSLYFAGDGGNSSSNGTLVTLLLKIKEGASAGEKPISINVVTCRNESLSEVTYNVAAGNITVFNFIYGDVNGDGKVDDLDHLILTQYINGWSVSIDAGADVNGDGKVDDLDHLILTQYINGWPVTLGP